MTIYQKRVNADGEVKLTEEQIDAIFEGAEDSSAYVIGLFAAVVPEWERVEQLQDSGACHPETWNYICGKAIAHDNEQQAETPYRDRVMPGGAWMNYGFSTDDTLAPWTVRRPAVETLCALPFVVEPGEAT